VSCVAVSVSVLKNSTWSEQRSFVTVNVDSSTGTAERLDAVKCDRSRCRRAKTTAARRAATAAVRPMGAFSTGVPVDWGLSQRLARVDCRLSYTTGQATIAQSAIVACNVNVAKRRTVLIL